MGLEDGLKDLKIASHTLGIKMIEVSPLADICREMVTGRNIHGEYNSRHEGLGVIVEEFDEFKDAIRENDDSATGVEAKQLAAAAMQFYLEFRA